MGRAARYLSLQGLFGAYCLYRVYIATRNKKIAITRPFSTSCRPLQKVHHVLKVAGLVVAVQAAVLPSLPPLHLRRLAESVEVAGMLVCEDLYVVGGDHCILLAEDEEMRGPGAMREYPHPWTEK